jgi:hypothetical protein
MLMPCFVLSFADSPPATDPTPVEPTATETVEEESNDPQVVALQAIFPDFDPIALCEEFISFPA